MVFNYYYNLTKKQQFIYRKSDQIETVALHRTDDFKVCISALKESMAREDRKLTAQFARQLINGMAVNLEIPALEVKVLAVRPANNRSELHGLYETAAGEKKAVITIWMRTAKHKRIVAFKTFLRTLLHEFCHHLDYEYYSLADSYHTEGFFKRESSLLKQLLPDAGQF